MFYNGDELGSIGSREALEDRRVYDVKHSTTITANDELYLMAA